METLEYRLAIKADINQIAGLSRDLIEAGLGWKWTPEKVLASIRSKTSNVLAARIGSRVIGFGIMDYYHEEAHLNLLAVRPKFHKQGIGKSIVNWLETCASTAGISIIYLECRSNNIAAQKFYEKLGYRKIKVVSGYYSGVEAAVLMGRDLLDSQNHGHDVTYPPKSF